MSAELVSAGRLQRVAAFIVNLGHDLDQNVPALLQLCGEIFHANCAFYTNLVGGQFRMEARWNAPPFLVDAKGGSIFSDVIAHPGGALILRELQASPQAETDPNVATQGWKTCWGHPIRSEPAIHGSLCLFFAHDCDPTGDDLQILEILSAAIRQVEERKQAENASRRLRQSEENYKSIFTNAPVGIYQSSIDGLLTVNATAASMFGYKTPEEMLSSTVDARKYFVHPDQRSKLIDQALQSASYARQEVKYFRKDGSSFTGNVSMRVVRGENGQVKFLEGFIEDITRRKKLEKELGLREQRLKSFFNTATAGLCIIDRELRFIQINETLARINGLSVEQHLGQTVRTILPKMAPMLEPLFRHILASGEPILNLALSGETPGAPGLIRHWMASYFPLHGEDGSPIEIGGVVVEITDAKRAEAALRDSEEKFRQLAENVDRVFWICDSEFTKILYTSPAYEKIWGRSVQSLYENPMSFVDPVHPDDRDRVLAHLQREKLGLAAEIEYRIVRPDGSVRWIHDRGFVVRNDKGEFYRLAGLAEDVTERRQLEEQLRQAQKMDAIGQLAGGVAHDFNNILAATLMQLNLLQQNAQLPAEVKSALQDVEAETIRAAGLTRQLLLFSRRQAAKVEPLELNSLISNLLKMLHRLLGENIEIAINDSPAAMWVNADAGMIEQVVMNLCINSRDAMPKGGNLTLTTAHIERSADSPQGNPDARAGRFVCLSVIDTGCGMHESVLRRIFEPFFTTKEVGRGTGLGLATVYGVVRQHQGWIEVETKLGVGSTFQVYLPARSEPPATTNSVNRSDEIAGGGETILLVEDELSLRKLAAVCLRKLGYAVLEAGRGSEALQVWAEHHQNIALLFTDMVMPGKMTGLDLAERLKKEKDSLKVILTSGYTADLTGMPVIAGQEIAFLAKPYKSVELARLVRSCLNSTQTGAP